MNKTQADAAAKAILDPHLQSQEEIRSKRTKESALLARKRRVAWCILAGCGIGAATAHFSGFRFSSGILWGGIAGSTVGWLISRRAA